MRRLGGQDRYEGSSGSLGCEQLLDQLAQRIGMGTRVRVSEGDQIADGPSQTNHHRVKFSRHGRRWLSGHQDPRGSAPAGCYVVGDRFANACNTRIVLFVENEDGLNLAWIVVA